MKTSIGYGAYGFGYASEPQWGIFNPPQSLFKTDPTLYDSLFATNEALDEAYNKARAQQRAKEHPGLSTPVGPRKAWKRDVTKKDVGEHNRLGDLGLISNNICVIGVTMLIAVVIIISLFN